MASSNVNNWTLSGIVMAFIDLSVVYTLLCGSAFAFICSNLLSFFGINLPCPCCGFFGYQNYDLCWHKLLIDWPRRKITAVEESIKIRFPFDFIAPEQNPSNLLVEGQGNRKPAKGISEFQGEACSTSLSGPTPSQSVEGERGFEAEGQKIMNKKAKSGIQRRKKAALGYGKVHPALSSNSSGSVAVGVLHPFYDCSGLIRTFSESLDAETTKEDSSPGNPGGSNDANVIRVLEHALEEEKAARAILYHELEKERAAAASAADEAMAMILRLQEDKASIEMEARQYQRVIEEKCNYDEEEMRILKEILLRREKEIHFFEKEIEAYEEMNSQHVEGDSNYKVKNKESDVNPPLMPLPTDDIKEKVGENWNQEGSNMCSSIIDAESTVFDVHVIDESHGNENEPSDAKSLSDCPNMGMEEIGLQQHFSTVIDGERSKIDNEIEWLRERLRVVQEEKERLTFSAEQSERVNAELKLVKDMVCQLQKSRVLKKRLRLDSSF